MNSIEDIVRYFDFVKMKQATGRLLAAGEKTPEAAAAPTPFVREKAEVTQLTCAGRPLWRLLPPGGKKPALRILYLHGGAYYHPAVPAHWKLMARMVERVNAEVFAPDYPLTPEFTYRDTFAMLEPLYRRMCRDAPEGRLIVMGDSAGGGLALALCQYAMEALQPLPEQAILLSPWLDVTMTDPAIAVLDKLDPFLEPVSGREIGLLYAGGDDPRRYRISPLYGPVEGLPPVTVFTGTRDILNADARALRRRLEGAQARYRFFEYPGMIHTWMLFAIPEAVDAFDKICCILTDDTAVPCEIGVESHQKE